MKQLAYTAMAACLALAPSAFAQDPTGPQAGVEATESADADAPMSEEEFARFKAEFDAALERRNGEIKIARANVTLNVPDGYYFLDVADSRKVLEDAWGNPPDTQVDGMLFPAGMSPLDEESWGVVLHYEDTGYVSDEDAASVDYDMLIDTMRDGEAAENAERNKAGFPAITLIGWAAEPRYDASTHKLYWAKELAFEGSPTHTLNYDMRVLGRRGVLSLNFIADISQVAEIERAGPGILSVPHFDAGSRYEDFNAATDQKADYGVTGLIAGGAAAAALAKNTGIFATLLVLLKKFWFVGIALVGGGITAVRNLFMGKKAKAAEKAEQRSATAFFDGPDAGSQIDTPPDPAVSSDPQSNAADPKV